MNKTIKYLSLSVVIALTIATNIFCDLHPVNPTGQTQINEQITFSQEREGTGCKVKIILNDEQTFITNTPAQVKNVTTKKGNDYIGFILQNNDLVIYDLEDSQLFNGINIQQFSPIKQVYINNDQHFYIRYQDNKAIIFEFSPTEFKQINQNIIQLKDKDIELEMYCSTGSYGIQYSDNSIDLFNIATGQPIQTIQAHKNTPIRTWDTRDFGNIFVVNYQDNSFDLHYLGTGQKNTIPANPQASDKHIIEWDIRGINENIFVIQYQDNSFDLFNIATSQPIQTIQANQEKTIEEGEWYLSNNKIFVVEYLDNSIDLFHITTGQLLNNRNKQIANWKTMSISTSSNRKIFAILYQEGSFDLFHITTGQLLNNRNKQLQGSKITKNGIIFTIQYRDRSSDILNLQSGNKIITHPNKIVKDIHSPHPLLVVVQYTDNTFDLFSAPTGERINQNKDIRIFHSEDKILYIVYKDNTLDIFDTATGTKIDTTFVTLQPDKAIMKIQYQPGEDIFPIVYRNKDRERKYFFIDLFNVRTKKKINRKLIQTQDLRKLENIESLTLTSSEEDAAPDTLEIEYKTMQFKNIRSSIPEQRRKTFNDDDEISLYNLIDLEDGTKKSFLRKRKRGKQIPGLESISPKKDTDDESVSAKATSDRREDQEGQPPRKRRRLG